MATANTTNTMGRTTDRRTVVGVFDGPNHAQKALEQLREQGFAPDQVSVVARESSESKELVEDTGMGATGAAGGALIGGLTGGVLGWLVGIGTLAIPGVGPIVAAGALATTLGGAALGAVAGGLVGALVDAGVPEEHARGYEEHVKGGKILLTVHAASDQQARQAHTIFNQHGGSDVRGYGFDADARDHDDDSAAGEMTTGSLVGGSIGGVAGAVVGGPVGLAAGAAIGGSAGAAAGGAAHDATDDDDDTTTRRTSTNHPRV